MLGEIPTPMISSENHLILPSLFTSSWILPTLLSSLSGRLGRLKWWTDTTQPPSVTAIAGSDSPRLLRPYVNFLTQRTPARFASALPVQQLMSPKDER